MRLKFTSATWWGAPKKFSSEDHERKISWLELFYDLVYVIAIAHITSHLSENHSAQGFLNYLLLFAIIFWSWMNGSLHHDLHGSEGLRTRLMTLWQMLIVAAMVVILDHHPGILHTNVIIIIMVMQLYITYLWWSVGIYDKVHRKLNKPYSILYILSLILFGISLFTDPEIRIWIFATAIVINFSPPFLLHWLREKRSELLSLSSSMAERLGLITIILFGEVMTGIVSGEASVKSPGSESWIQFGLSVFIVFALWWIFFTLISDRKCKHGLLNGATLEMIYLITLIALGILGMAFRNILDNDVPGDENPLSTKTIFGFTSTFFLFSIYLMIYMMEYSSEVIQLRKSVQRLILYGAIMLFFLSLLSAQIQLLPFLLLVLLVILVVIALINFKWYKLYAGKKSLKMHQQKNGEKEYPG